MEVYYVEDDSSIASTVGRYLEAQGWRVTLLNTVEQARQALSLRLPSLLLVDWNMPDGRGDDLCLWARAQWQRLPIILLTVRADSRDVIAGLRNGADDYVTKPFDLDVLHTRMLALLRRSGDVSSDFLSCGPIHIDLKRRHATLASREIALTPAEYELLLLLMRNAGRTVTREHILRHLWDERGSFVNDNTLTVTMKRLREKLGPSAQIVTVRSVGYRMEDKR